MSDPGECPSASEATRSLAAGPPARAGRRQRGTLAFALLLAATLLVLALRGVSWEELLATARQAQPEYFALCYIVGLGSYFLRSRRWRVLLSAEKPLPRPKAPAPRPKAHQEDSEE